MLLFRTRNNLLKVIKAEIWRPAALHICQSGFNLHYQESLLSAPPQLGAHMTQILIDLWSARRKTPNEILHRILVQIQVISAASISVPSPGLLATTSFCLARGTIGVLRCEYV